MPPKITVLGAGVSGLTCSVRLAEAGFVVETVASALPPNTNSDAAAAVWYPYRAFPQERVLAWGTTTLAEFESLALDPDSGVRIVDLHEVFTAATPDPWWRSAIRRFRRLTAEELPPGYVDGFSMTVPSIDVPKYLPYLMRRLTAAGGVLRPLARRVRDLGELISYGEIVVNCSGVGARAICDDNAVVPIRGQVVRVTNPGVERATVDESGPAGVGYVVPHRGSCVLGTTAIEGDEDDSIRIEESDDILRRCAFLEPRIAAAEIVGVKAGVRAGRDAIRLEQERVGASWIIHNYGHGGAGFTLSWGCADEVLAMVRGLSRVTR